MAARGWYQASQFARMTGVTVRALHHYDRLGLLTPAGRTSSGYRLYGERDFARLQQIVTLKFIGFPLKQIKRILERGSSDLTVALRKQRKILEEKRRHLEKAINAIEKAERAMASDDEPDWEAFNNIIEVINMQNNWDWVEKYYTQEQLDDIASRATPETLERGQREWAKLIKDVEASLDEDPASEKAQALADRWSALIEEFTGGDPGILENLKRLYADQANWPSSAQKPFSGEVSEFINRAIAARSEKES